MISGPGGRGDDGEHGVEEEEVGEGGLVVGFLEVG